MLFQQGGGEALGFVVPLTKIDVPNRTIYARAAQEHVDNAGQIMDYATAKPEFERWSMAAFEATGGLSKGNVRVMHTRNACGKVTDLAFNDDDKAVDVCLKIVDENEFQKCVEGVYTGLSIGGGYARKWKDNTGATRYTPRLAEISLVDNPCIPTCRFAELVKADGVVEQVALRGRPHSFAELWSVRPRSFLEIYSEQTR